jgi:hypothetical protein
MPSVTQSNSEQAFAKALAAENAGDNAKAEMWLKLAVKRESEENGAVPPSADIAVA